MESVTDPKIASDRPQTRSQTLAGRLQQRAIEQQAGVPMGTAKAPKTAHSRAAREGTSGSGAATSSRVHALTQQVSEQAQALKAAQDSIKAADKQTANAVAKAVKADKAKTKAIEKHDILKLEVRKLMEQIDSLPKQRRSAQPAQQQCSTKTDLLQQLKAFKAQACQAAQEAEEAIAAKNDSLQQVLTESQEDRQNAQQAAAIAAARIASLEQQLTTSVAEAEQCQRIIDSWQVRFDTGKRAEEERASADAASNADLRNQLQQSRGEYQEAANTISSQATDIERLLQAVQQADIRASGANSRMALLQSQLDTSQHSNTQLSATVDGQQGHMASLEQQLTQVKQEAEQAQAQAAKHVLYIGGLEHELFRARGHDSAAKVNMDNSQQAEDDSDNESIANMDDSDNQSAAPRNMMEGPDDVGDAATAVMQACNDNNASLGNVQDLGPAVEADAAEQAAAADNTVTAMQTAHEAEQQVTEPLADKLGAADAGAVQSAPGSSASPQAAGSATSATTQAGQAAPASSTSSLDMGKATACAVSGETKQPESVTSAATSAVTGEAEQPEVVTSAASSSATAACPAAAGAAKGDTPQAHETGHVSSQAAEAHAAASASPHMWPTSLKRTGYSNALYEAQPGDSDAQQPSHTDISDAPQHQNVDSKTKAATNANNNHKQSCTAEPAASTSVTQAPEAPQHDVNTAVKPDVHSMAQPHQAADSSAHPAGTPAAMLDTPHEGGNVVLTDESAGTRMAAAKLLFVSRSVTRARSQASRKSTAKSVPRLAGTKRLAVEGAQVDDSLGKPSSKQARLVTPAEQDMTYCDLPPAAIAVPLDHGAAAPAKSSAHLGKRQLLTQEQAEGSSAQEQTASSPHTRPCKQAKTSISGSTDDEQASGNLLSTSHSADADSNRLQSSVFHARDSITASQSLEQQQQEGTTPGHQAAAESGATMHPESSTSGHEYTAESSEAAQQGGDTVTQHAAANGHGSQQQDSHVLPAPMPSSGSDTTQHTSETAAAAQQQANHEQQQQQFEQDEAYDQEGEIWEEGYVDPFQQWAEDELLQEQQQQDPPELVHSQDSSPEQVGKQAQRAEVEEVQQLREPSPSNEGGTSAEEGTPSLVSQEDTLHSEDSEEHPWQKRIEFQANRDRQIPSAEDHRDENLRARNYNSYIMHLHNKVSRLARQIRLGLGKMDDARGVIAWIKGELQEAHKKKNLEKRKQLEEELLEELQEDEENLRSQNRLVISLVKHIKEVVWELGRNGEEVTGIKRHLADLLDMPVAELWAQQLQAQPENKAGEEGRNQQDMQSGVMHRAVSGKQEEVVHELFDMSPAAPELPTVQVPSRWNLRADPRKWSRLGPGGAPAGHPWAADFGDNLPFFQDLAAQSMKRIRKYHGKKAAPERRQKYRRYAFDLWNHTPEGDAAWARLEEEQRLRAAQA